MIFKPEPRRGGLDRLIFTVVVIALLSYMSFAALQGKHGLFQLFAAQAEEVRLRSELNDLRAERLVIANKTRRLSPPALDRDLLDEQARRVLGLGRADELIIR